MSNRAERRAQGQVELHIPQAPDFLFKNRTTGYLLNEKNIVPMIEKMEAVEGFGMCIYYKGVPYAKKGFPTPEGIYALNQVKKILFEGSKFIKNPFFLMWLLFTNKTKLCQSFNVIFHRIFGQFTLKDEFMCRSAFNFANFVHGVLMDMGIDHDTAKEFAFNIAQILEWDDSYRYRFQDIMGELNPNANLRKEFKRLILLFKARTTNRVAIKLEAIFFVLNFLLIFKGKSIKKHIHFLKQAQPDEHDKYWLCIRNDNYNYFGLTTEQRHELYTERTIVYEAMV